jgi:hypothetical protein
LGLTTPTGGGTPMTMGGDLPPSRGARIINLYPNPAVVNLVPTTTKLKDLIGTTDPPKLNNGHEMCLSFLLHNGCWSNCHQATQHNSNLTANEQQHLAQYLMQHLAATTLRPTPSPSDPTPPQAS